MSKGVNKRKTASVGEKQGVIGGKMKLVIYLALVTILAFVGGMLFSPLWLVARICGLATLVAIAYKVFRCFFGK